MQHLVIGSRWWLAWVASLGGYTRGRVGFACPAALTAPRPCCLQLPEDKARTERSLLSYSQKLSRLQQQQHEQAAEMAALHAGMQGFAAQVTEMRNEERSLKRQLADASRRVQEVKGRMEEAQVGAAVAL